MTTPCQPEKPMIALKNIQKRIEAQEILKGINLEVACGETMVVIGRSGGGKSVLIKHIVGLMKPDSGQIVFDGVDITNLGERELAPIRRRVGILFQGGALFDSFTVAQNIAFPLVEGGEKDQKVIKDKVAEALEVVDLQGQEEKMPVNLSGGMKKRVGLARAVITRPSCILYDEPTAGLDPIGTDSIDHLIRRLQKRFSVTSVVITHDMKSAWHIADRISYMHEGKIYFTGTPSEITKCEDPVIKNFIEGRSGESQ